MSASIFTPNDPTLKRLTSLKALAAGDPEAGGYIVADQPLAEILAAERDLSVMREVGRVLPTLNGGMVRLVPSVESFMSDAEWTSELNFGPADAQLAYGSRRLVPKPIAKHVVATKSFGQNQAIDVEAHVKEMLSRAVAVPQERSFLLGEGVAEPLGLLKTPSLPTYVTATEAQIYGDDLIAWIYSLPAKYRRRASIITSSTFIRKVRLLSKPNAAGSFDNRDDAPKFEPATATSLPRLEGVPVYESDEFPSPVDESDAFVSGQIVAVILDARFFWIQDSSDLRLQKIVELYAEQNKDIWTIRQETDAGLVLPESALALVVK